MAVEIGEGLIKFLVAQLESILDDLNADLAAKVKANGSIAPFVIAIGDVPNPAGPTLCVDSSARTRQRVCDTEVAVWVTCKILCLIPTMGDDTSMNFAMARIVADDHVSTLMLNDAVMLLPVIDAGDIPSLQAEEAYAGDVMDIWPRKIADGKTYVRGWATTYTAKFNIETRTGPLGQ